MARDVVEPTVDEADDKFGARETHPAWAIIGASRVQSGPPGATLFDSEIRHHHYVVVTLRQARRRRNLNRDWVGADGRLPIVEVAMSEAQWAQFVSSMNQGDGVPCTLTMRERDYADGKHLVPGMPYSPRMQQSMDEVRAAADKSLEAIREAFALVKEKPNKGNIRNLEIVLGNATPNMTYAAKSLAEHAEGVVTKARADIEAMVIDQAQRLGLEPGDLGVGLPELIEGESEPVE